MATRKLLEAILARARSAKDLDLSQVSLDDAVANDDDDDVFIRDPSEAEEI
jgi:hypothetical protein